MFRTKEQREVDFVLVIDEKPVQMLEVKLTDAKVSKSLKYFYDRYEVPAIQLVKNLQQERLDQGIEIRNALQYLKLLKM